MKLQSGVCVALALVFGLAPLATAATMPVAQQNALLQKHCVVCHNETHMNGGLSLQRFDSAQPDPGLAAMIVSKLKGGAMGAAGIPLDRETENALTTALSEKTEGAGEWTLNGTSPTSVSIVQRVATARNPDLYRLKLTCRTYTHQGEIQLSWSPGVPENGTVMSVAVDGNAPQTYTIEGKENMANGQPGTSGPGAIVLSATQRQPLPEKTLTVQNLFASETVVFPFGGLPQPARRDLAACFGR